MAGEVVVACHVAHQFFEEVTLGFFQGLDAFFYRASRHHAVDEDGFGLADAVDSVDGLRFDSGVPPGVEEENVVGGVEGDAGAAGFERD